ncbi:hypothetical protein Cpir12675_000580 [Ceratocystis pirilliformis]|uniref:DUF2066 domain-containing protein n=1 Tax=Ceratocystis pirilliformis TaxID=259994 RepID=A0ABR3ZM45_9PEZI
MKFSLYSLSLGFYLFGSAQADILNDKEYDVLEPQPQKYMVFSPELDTSNSQLSMLFFYPEEKVSTVIAAKNDEEAVDDPELSFTEIYNALLKRAKMTSDEIRWLIFDVDKDEEISQLSLNIRQERGLDPKAQVEILPNEEEWKIIMQSEYYMQAVLIIGKQADRIVLRVQESPEWWENIYPSGRIQFFFSPPDNEISTSGDDGETYWLSGDEESALFSRMEEQEAAIWAETFSEAVGGTLTDLAA